MTIFVAIHISAYFSRNPELIKTYWKHFVQFGGAFFIGISPMLYYVYIIQGHTSGRMEMNGDVSDLIRRLIFMLRGLAYYVNFRTVEWVYFPILFVFLYFAKTLIAEQVVKIKTFISGSKPVEAAAQISPILFLPIAVGAIYCSATVAIDPGTRRYILPILFFIALICGFGLVRLWNSPRKRAKRRRIALALFGTLLIHNGTFFYRDLRNIELPNFNGIVRYLNERGVRYAYANYWYAYSISFLSNEQIIIDPMWADYNPEYGPLVHEQSKVAYIDEAPFTVPVTQTTIDLKGRHYLIKDRTVIGNATVLVLEAES